MITAPASGATCIGAIPVPWQRTPCACVRTSSEGYAVLQPAQAVFGIEAPFRTSPYRLISVLDDPQAHSENLLP